MPISLRVTRSDDCEWCVVLCTGSCSSECSPQCCEKEKVASREIESTLTPKEKKERVELCEKYGEKAEQLRQSHKLRAQQKCPDCRKNSVKLTMNIVRTGTEASAGKGEKAKTGIQTRSKTKATGSQTKTSRS